MKTSKKILSLLLIAAMLVSVLCMGVSASDYAEVSISEGEPVTISWSGTTGTVVSVDGSSYIPRQFVFGETSAEVCGLYVANGDGSGAATTTPTVKVGTSTVTTSNMGTVTKKVYSATTKVTVTSGAENIYVNGEKVTSGTEITFSTPSGSTNYVQVITQSGTEAPYITMVKITR